MTFAKLSPKFSLRWPLALLLFACASLAQAQLVTFSNAQSGAPGTVAPNATATNLTRGTGIVAPATPCGSWHSSTDFNISAAQHNFAAALAGNQYVEFTITPDPGTQLRAQSLRFGTRRSGTGPTTTQVTYSRDGGATWIELPLEAASGTGSCNSFLNYTIPFENASGVASEVFTTQPLIVRFVAWGATGTGGTYQLGNIEVAGETRPAPAGAQLLVQNPLGTDISCGDTIRLGRVFLGDEVLDTFRIYNSGTANVAFNSFTFSGSTAGYGYQSASPGGVINPGNFVQAVVRFEATQTGIRTIRAIANTGLGACTLVYVAAVPVTASQSLTLCQGDTLSVGTSRYFATGTFSDTLTTVAGYDSILTTTITAILPRATSTRTETLCAGQGLTIQGVVYDQTGSYTITLPGQAANGCDSVQTLELTVLPQATGTRTETICAGQSITINGTDYAQPGSYVITLAGQAANGCDSILTLDLTILPDVTATLVETLCAGESITIAGSEYSQTGITVIMLAGQAANGCDSILTLDLTILPQAAGTRTETICAGASININGTDFDQTGSYTITLPGQAASGCDSILTLDLTVSSGVAGTRTDTLCVGQSLTIGGQTFDQAGTFNIQLPGQGAGGCDSTLTLNLIVAPTLDTTVTVNQANGTLSLPMQAGVSYQWHSCLSGLPLLQGTSNTFRVMGQTVPGPFFATLTVFNCETRTGCYDLPTSRTDAQAPQLRLYPNPATTQLTIEAPTAIESLRVIDAQGRAVLTQTLPEATLRWELPLGEMASGIYVIQAQTANGLISQSFWVKPTGR